MTMTLRPRRRRVVTCLAAMLGGLLLATSAPAVAAPAALPKRLSVSGANVLDPQGRPIVLRGYNWGQWGTVQPQDAADNVAQGANSVRIPLRWWGDWRDGVDSRDVASPGHIDPAHLAILS